MGLLDDIFGTIGTAGQEFGQFAKAIGPFASSGYGLWDFLQRQQLMNNMSPGNVMNQADKLLTPQRVENIIRPVMGSEMSARGNATPGLFGLGIGDAVASEQLNLFNQILNAYYGQLGALGQPPDVAQQIANATGSSLTGSDPNSGTGKEWFLGPDINQPTDQLNYLQALGSLPQLQQLNFGGGVNF